MSEPRLDALRAIPLFSELSDEAIGRIAELATEAEASPGQVLIEAGREGSGLFLIEEGTVMVERGDRTVELGPGDFVGELALLAPGATRSARVQARTGVRFVAISRAHFEKLIEEEPKIALGMLRVLANRLAHTTSL